MSTILNRRSLVLSSRMQAFWSTLVSCCCRYARAERLSRESILYTKATKRLYEQDLDLSKLVKTLQQVRNLSKAVLSKRQYFLLRHQRRDLVLTDASSTDSDADIKKLESGNKFLKLLALSKVRHEANLFLEDDINDTDSRLLHGVY